MMRSIAKFWGCTIALLAVLAVPMQASAADPALPADTQVVVNLDLSRFKATTIGERLLEFTIQTAAAETGTDDEQLLTQVHETLGFDPLDEIGAITIAVSDIKNPPESASVIVELGDTTGNIEGLLLAAPGYNSKEHGKYTLHSAGEGRRAATGAIHVGKKGNHWIVVSPSEDRVVSLLGSLSTPGGESGLSASAQLPDNAFAAITLSSLALDEVDDQPFANIVGSLERATVSIAEDGDNLRLSASLETINEKRAQQITQLVQGASAAFSLMMDSIDELQDNPELRDAAISVVQSLEISQENTSVSIKLELPLELVFEFLREEADLPL